MAKLDDFLTKKKETVPILDMSKTVINSKEEFRRLLERVPDFRIKPEKVLPETIKIREKNFKFKINKNEVKRNKEKYNFMNPLPVEMIDLKLEDLCAVSIDWKMLTDLRPKSKIEENYFSRLIEIGKLQNKSRAQERRQFQMDSQIRKSKNKCGVVETRVVSCTECGEDFCNGKSCCKYGYDTFARLQELPTETEKKMPPNSGAIPKIKIKQRSRSKSKTKRRDKRKSPTKQESKTRKK